MYCEVQGMLGNLGQLRLHIMCWETEKNTPHSAETRACGERSVWTRKDGYTYECFNALTTGWTGCSSTVRVCPLPLRLPWPCGWRKHNTHSVTYCLYCYCNTGFKRYNVSSCNIFMLHFTEWNLLVLDADWSIQCSDKIHKAVYITALNSLKSTINLGLNIRYSSGRTKLGNKALEVVIIYVYSQCDDGLM